MPSESMTGRYSLAVAAVSAFFGRFYGGDVFASDDVEEEAVLFRVGEMRKTVAVAADFLEFDVDEIPEKLAAWNVAHLSRTLERGCRLKVTSEGPEEERD